MSSAGSGSLPKPYGCRNCPRSFATRLALSNHMVSTGHRIVCTTRGCTKAFLSSSALADHLKSPAHIKPTIPTVPASTISVRRDAAPTPNNQSQPSVQLFACTKSGCTKTFRTSSSRAQHLRSASHGKKSTTPPIQTASVTNAKTENRPAATASGSGLRTSSNKSNTLLGKNVESQDSATGKPALQTPNSVEHLGKTAIAPKPARSTIASPPKPHEHVPLFRWDTRWSKISSTMYESTMNALIAAIPPMESWLMTGVDKEYWTPDQMAAPSYQTSIPKRRAIVLDCEMVGIGRKGAISELARLSAVDFLTGELLIDTLVEPFCPVTDMRTRWSGITAESMKAAVASGTALKGSTAARTQLFKYMDSETILIGHSLQYDLAALGIDHWLTVDSATLAEKAVGKKVKRRWGLKVLCKELLRIDVQDHGNNGHDSVEDTLAAREVVLWCLSHKKELKAWGKKKKEEYYAEGARTKQRSQATRPKKTPATVFSGYDSDGYEFRCMSMRELNEFCHYPEWYDNWSD